MKIGDLVCDILTDMPCLIVGRAVRYRTSVHQPDTVLYRALHADGRVRRTLEQRLRPFPSTDNKI